MTDPQPGWLRRRRRSVIFFALFLTVGGSVILAAVDHVRTMIGQMRGV